MKSQASAVSQPPPKAAPLTAAMTGTGQARIACTHCSKTACWRRQSSCVMPSRSFRSPPALNALSPRPVSTTQRIPSLSMYRARMSSSCSRPIRVLRAFANSGRSNMTSRTCSSIRST